MTAAERDSKFAKRTAEAAARVLAFKKKSAKMMRRTKQPSAAAVERLSRRLWEFGEQIRLDTLAGAEKKRDLRIRRCGRVHDEDEDEEET